MDHPALRRALRLVLVAAVLVPLGACNSLLGTSERQPNEARVVVTGSSAVPLRLVLSTNFTAELNAETGNWDVNLLTFETHDLELPIEQTVQLNTDRFFARLVNLSDEVVATVHMQVLFDGRLAYNQQATLQDARLEFIHVFF